MSGQNMIRLGQPVPPAMAEVVDIVSSCIQCGTCSGSCPTAPAMDYTPRLIMQMVLRGEHDEVLRSQAIWMCASCHSCTVRCPRGIPVADVLAQLCGIAIEEGYAETTGMTFTKAFLRVVKRYGRMYEPELMLRYHARQEQLGLLGAIPVALALLRKGKIGFLPEKLPASDGGDEVRRIFQRVAARRKLAKETRATS